MLDEEAEEDEDEDDIEEEEDEDEEEEYDRRGKKPRKIGASAFIDAEAG